jgi:hypothetical protein
MTLPSMVSHRHVQENVSRWLHVRHGLAQGVGRLPQPYIAHVRLEAGPGDVFAATLAMPQATEQVGAAAAVISVTRCFRANLRNRYPADGGKACTASPCWRRFAAEEPMKGNKSGFESFQMHEIVA